MSLETLFTPEIRALLTLFVMLSLPGWALLAVSGLWRRFSLLQRWCVAAGISTAFYPVLYYLARALLPNFQIGPNKLTVFFVLCILAIGWGLRKNWREQLRLEPLEQWAVFLFALAFLVRFWIAHTQPYPAWSDSLHHTMLTQLTASSGRLPLTLEPYEAVPLNMYHLGLYSISGPLQALARIPAQTALLWAAQALNGLGVLSVYLALDRSIGRRAALAGAAVTGLFCLQPAWYVNWGRFTQVSAQAILLTAWLLTLEAFKAVRDAPPRWKGETLGLLLAAGLLNAGTFLLHYRVAAYYIPLLLLTVLGLLVQAVRQKRVRRWLSAAGIIGGLAVLFILPALAQALPAYLARSSGSYVPSAVNLEYFTAPLEGIFVIGAQKWLVIAAAVGALLGLLARKKLALLTLVWVLLLFALGNAYRLGLRVLNVTNLSAIFIMLYLPISLLIGAGVQALAEHFAAFWQKCEGSLLRVILILALFWGGFLRMNAVEGYRYFMTAADERAMQWIAANTLADARFAINTVTWAGGSPHGTDGGYWIPYFTLRGTSAGTMLYNLAGREHTSQVHAASQAAQQLEGPAPNPQAACGLGLRYAYLGAKGNFDHPGLNRDALLALPGAQLLYDQEGVAIIQVCP